MLANAVRVEGGGTESTVFQYSVGSYGVKYTRELRNAELSYDAGIRSSLPRAPALPGPFIFLPILSTTGNRKHMYRPIKEQHTVPGIP